MKIVIVASPTKLEVPSNQVGEVSDANREYQKVAFRVIKETTEKAYHKYRLEYAPNYEFIPWPFPVWYYEILMD